MSKCISSHGEYSEHEGTGEYCDWCGDCNHAAIIAAAEQHGSIKALRGAADIKLGNGYYEMLVEDELNTRADQMEADDD